MQAAAKRTMASVLSVMMIMTSLPSFARDDAAAVVIRPPSGDEVEMAIARTGTTRTVPPSLKEVLGERMGEVASISSTAGFIFLATTAQVFKERYYKAKRRGDPHDITDIATRKMLKDAAGSVVTSEEFWMGLMGGHVAGATFIKTAPAVKMAAEKIFAPEITTQTLNSMLGTSAAKAVTKAFLVSGVTSVITFAGWEAFGQLWRDAVQMLTLEQPDPKADWIKKSHGVAFRVFGHLDNPNYRNTEDFQILQHIVLNIAAIIGDPILRERWEYNTFRLHWMTGDFLTMSTAMAIFPTSGALLGGQTCGFLCGLAGSVAGTIAALAVVTVMPQSWKDSLTEIARSARAWTNGQQLITNEKEISENLRQFQTYRRLNAYMTDAGAHLINEDDKYDAPFMQELEARRKIRQREMTALFETYFRTAMKIQNGQDEIEDATYLLQHKENWAQLSVQYQSQTMSYDQLRQKVCSGNCDVDYQLQTLHEAHDAIIQAKVNLEPLATQAMAIYGHEVQLMNRYLSDRRQPLTLKMIKSLQNELAWTCDVSMKLRTIFASKNPDMTERLGMDKSFLDAIKKYDLTRKVDYQISDFYLNTFDEAALLKQFGDDEQTVSAATSADRNFCVNDAKQMAPNTPFW